MRMSILLFPGYTALDIVGGYESLCRIQGIEVEFVAKEKGVIPSDTGAMGLLAYRTLKEAAGTDILYVPGGPGGYAAQNDPAILKFIRDAHAGSTWTMGVCNGVEILANSGILKDVEVTTNFFARERVAALGAKVLRTRYHRDGKIVTGAGVSASADAGLFLTSLIVGQEIAEIIQLGIEISRTRPSGRRRLTSARRSTKRRFAGSKSPSPKAVPVCSRRPGKPHQPRNDRLP